MVTDAVVLTAKVVTGKVAVVAPAETVTLAGTVAAVVLLLASVTTAPPLSAAALRVTVPFEMPPPSTLAGFRETDVRIGALTALKEIMEVFELTFVDHVHIPLWFP